MLLWRFTYGVFGSGHESGTPALFGLNLREPELAGVEWVPLNTDAVSQLGALRWFIRKMESWGLCIVNICPQTARNASRKCWASSKVSVPKSWDRTRELGSHVNKSLINNIFNTAQLPALLMSAKYPQQLSYDLSFVCHSGCRKPEVSQAKERWISGLSFEWTKSYREKYVVNLRSVRGSCKKRIEAIFVPHFRLYFITADWRLEITLELYFLNGSNINHLAKIE